MKKFMQDSRLMVAPATDPEKKKTDLALWKQRRAEYYNSRTGEWIQVYKCPMNYRCRCPARVRICTGKDYIRLEFHGTHDALSHAADKSKTLSYKQIVTIHDAVMVAPKQSATVLRRNLMHVQGSPDQHKHMPPSQLRCIQRRVQTSWKILTQ